MRLLLVTCVVALLPLPVAVAGLDPSALVIGTADVPAGFRVDPNETGVRTNAVEARELPELKGVFARWKRVNGYQAKYRRGTAHIEARADLFRTAYGADEFLALVHREARKAGISGQRLASFRIGADGWIFWAGPSYTLVAWRQGPVFTAVFADGIPRAQTIALARAQQRRVVATLR